MAAVGIVAVSKFFGTTPVLKGISLDIVDGEFLTLVGPSGCGKSTLLRIIAGLEAQDEGDVRIGGRVVNRVPPKQRDVAMVFQSYALYPYMTVAENLALPLEMRKLGPLQRLPLLGPFLPGSRSARRGIDREVSAVANALSIGQQDVITGWYAFPGQNAIKITDTINDHLQTVVNKSKEPQAALAQMTKDVEALLPKRS